MKNKIVIIGDIAIVEIRHKGKIFSCYIDTEDISKVSNIRGTWHINVNKNGNIDGVKTKVQNNLIRKQIWLHNVVFNKADTNNVVDHIDHNPLNNVKTNLREVSAAENAQNITIQISSKTGYRNVTLENGRYRVRINGKSFGRYKSFDDAKRVADSERSKIFPLASNLNAKIRIS